MSNKNIVEEPWKAPLFVEVNKTVQSLGGIASVCRITKKHRNTVSMWCNGKIKIDYANWKLISEIDRILGFCCPHCGNVSAIK